MPKGLSNTQRTLRELRQQGRICGIVEKWNAYAGPHGQRQDLFGFIDIIALDPQRGIVGVQSCDNSVKAHLRKIKTECYENATEWLKSGGHIEIWGWRKVKKKRGGKLEVWSPRIMTVTQEDLDAEDTSPKDTIPFPQDRSETS